MDDTTKQNYHYFASSFIEWRTSDDVRELVRTMDELGDDYKIYRVPLPSDAKYKVWDYEPVVEDLLPL